ncbi:MAG: hypothetical protein ACXABI_05190 [Candidatus Hodarchaeales archaeon]
MTLTDQKTTDTPLSPMSTRQVIKFLIDKVEGQELRISELEERILQMDS